MRVIVNGDEIHGEWSSLEHLLCQLGYDGDWLATAVNGELVHRQDRSNHSLNMEDRIEVLSPMQGG